MHLRARFGLKEYRKILELNDTKIHDRHAAPAVHILYFRAVIDDFLWNYH
jgi:hypothetical protein